MARKTEIVLFNRWQLFHEKSLELESFSYPEDEGVAVFSPGEVGTKVDVVRLAQ
jgi:hypothetical protein